jgi:beta-phosphoglucomutase-like phosphatase (HAD superfamily)
LPEPVDEIIVRCRTYVMAAAPRLVVIDENVRIARAAQARGQRLAIGSDASTNTVAAGLAATGLDTLFRTVVTWSDVPAGRGIIWRCLTILLLSAAKAGQARKARVPTRLR